MIKIEKKNIMMKRFQFVKKFATMKLNDVDPY